MRFNTGGRKRALRGARKPLLAALIAGAALCSPLSASANPPASTPSQTALAPGEMFASTMTGPQFGMNRQGGCNEINAITDPTFGQVLEFKVSDSDHTLPGTNSAPYGGCYPVHRLGGVAASLLAPSVQLNPGQRYFISLGIDIPSVQPGLPSGRFPTKLPGWFLFHETYGAPMKGSPVTGLGLIPDPVTGQTDIAYGPANQPYSFLEPLTLDVMHNITIDLTVSPSATVGRVAVTDNGVPLLDNAGSAVANYATQVASDNQGSLIPYLLQYRSNNWGGTTRMLSTGIKVGTTLASVQSATSLNAVATVVDQPQVAPSTGSTNPLSSQTNFAIPRNDVTARTAARRHHVQVRRAACFRRAPARRRARRAAHRHGSLQHHRGRAHHRFAVSCGGNLH